MKTFMIPLLATLFLLPLGAAAEAADGDGAKGDDVLVVRYACLIGGREAGTAPTTAGVMSRGELSEVLLAWNPGSDNAEVSRVFALNELGELARQASQLPLAGGSVSGVYAHGSSSFEVGMRIRPTKAGETQEDAVTITAEIKRNGELLSGSTLLTPLGERAIVTATNGPEAPFLFLVTEVDRVSGEELMRRGLRHSWRKDVHLVDGEEVTQPIALEKTPPAYTPEAKEARHQGRVVLRVVIDAGGAVEDVEVVEGQPYGLNEAATAAVRQWRFQPALLDGEPVPVLYLLTINFRLEK